MLGVHHSAICTADVERSLRFWRDGLGLTELFDHTFTGNWPELFGARSDRLRSIFLGDPHMQDCGIVELVEFQGAEEALAALGFTGDVGRITVAAPAGETVAMAVITALDGVLVELIGPAQ